MRRALGRATTMRRANSTVKKGVARGGSGVSRPPAPDEERHRAGQGGPIVIALASLKGYPVVTQQDGGSATKRLIPYVCQQRGVDCMNFLAVIRAEEWTF